MVEIIPEAPNFGARFARGLGAGLSQGVSQAGKFAQQMKLQEYKRNAFKSALENEKFEIGLNTLQDMRNIASKGNIGRGSAFLGFFGGETAKDRAEFAQLGTSLIPLAAAGVPIRNQKEFDQYKKIITDPSSSLGEIEGAISGLEKIFQEKLTAHESGLEKEGKGKTRFDVSNPEHKAKRDQVLKRTKGNREEAQKILEREFEL